MKLQVACLQTFTRKFILLNSVCLYFRDFNATRQMKNWVLKKRMHSLVTNSLPTLTESVPSHSKESDVDKCEVLSSVPDDSENNF